MVGREQGRAVATLIETPRGWLMLYHGVRHTAAGCLYRLGLALFDLEHPEHCLARGDSWIFGPEESYERERRRRQRDIPVRIHDRRRWRLSPDLLRRGGHEHRAGDGQHRGAAELARRARAHILKAVDGSTGTGARERSRAGWVVLTCEQFASNAASIGPDQHRKGGRSAFSELRRRL